MPSTLRYIGANERFFETAVTGSPQVWLRNQSGEVSEAHAALLLATGLFQRYERDPVFEQHGQLVTPSGEVVGLSEGDGLNANTEDSSTVTQARQVKAAAGRVTSILCLTGSAITLTLYDNAAASATGRQIYTGSLSSGDVVIPDAAWFAHGCYAGFTGTAAFVINTSEASE